LISANKSYLIYDKLEITFRGETHYIAIFPLLVKGGIGGKFYYIAIFPPDTERGKDGYIAIFPGGKMARGGNGSRTPIHNLEHLA
jgi:hypothetical protein